MVPIFGVILTGLSIYTNITLNRLNSELEGRKIEIGRRQEFAKIIHDQISNLISDNHNQSAIVISSLYTLAENDFEKIVIFTISRTSDIKKEVFFSLIQEDPTASELLKDYIRLALGKSLQNSLQEDETQNHVERFDVDTAMVMQPEISSEIGLLKSLTQNIEGWIYLGKTRIGSLTLEEDKTIEDLKIPSRNEVIKTITSINLRDQSPKQTGSLGNIIGIINEKLTLKIKEVETSRIDKVYDAVWANVTSNHE